MKKQPLVIYTPSTDKLKKLRKDGTMLKYRCPSCLFLSDHRSRVIRHMLKCKAIEQDKIDADQQDENLGNMQIQNNQNLNIQSNHQLIELENLEVRVSQLEKQIQPDRFTLLHLDEFQRKNYQRLLTLIDEVMSQSVTLCSIIKSTLMKQLNSLIQLGFKTSDLIVQLRPVVFSVLQNVNYIQGFSLFKKNVIDFQKYLKNEFKDEVAPTWYNKMMRGWAFLKKYTEADFIHQHRIIEDLMKQKPYKREIIVQVYKKMTNLFSDKFPYRQMPTRLIKKSSVIMFKHNQLKLGQVKASVKTLLSQQQYQLATDLWMVTTMGLRLRQLRKVRFRLKSDQLADNIRIFENKNRNLTTRVVPLSLKQLIIKYKVQYPMTDQRLKKLKSYCFSKFHAFYGLRSLCITSIIECLIKTDDLARFHKQSNTTIKYYLNRNSSLLINKMFAFQQWSENIEDSGTTIYIKQDGEIEFLKQSNDQKQHEMNVDSNDVEDIVQENQKDSISSLSNSNIIQMSKLHQISPEEEKDIKFQKFKLDNDLELNKQQFSSISQAILGEINYDNNDFIQSSEISLKCDTSIRLITYCDDQSKSHSQLNLKSPQSTQQIVIVKRVKSKGCVYNVEDKQINRQLLREKYDRKCKKKAIREVQNLPQLQQKDFLCPCCSLGQLQLKKCIINQNHLMVICLNCSTIHHQCKQITEGMTSVSIMSVSDYESELFLPSLRAENIRNNINQTLEKQQRFQLKSCLFKMGTPTMKCKYPKFSTKMKRQIQYNQNQQNFLPLTIKMTSNMGNGVFATREIGVDQLICCYNGIIGTNNNINFQHDSFVNLGWAQYQNEFINVGLEADRYCNIGRYLNSSNKFDDPRKNCQMTIGLIETVNFRFDVVFLISSIRKIKKNEQLLWYYGDEYWNVNSHILKDLNQQQHMQEQQNYQKRNKVDLIFQNESIQEQRECFQKDNNLISPKNEEVGKEFSIEKKNLISPKDLYIEQRRGKDCPINQLQKSKKKKKIKEDSRFHSYGIECDQKFIFYKQDEPFQIASIVKLFVYIYCQRMLSSSAIQLEQKFIMPKFSSSFRYTTCQLVTSEVYSLKDLLNGMLISSGCDASYCICYNIGSKFSKMQDNEEFIPWVICQLNKMVKQFGLEKTKICDVTGLGETTSSVQDLMVVLKYLRKCQQFHEILAKNSYFLKSGKKTVLLKNTNMLLSEKIYGKTGTGKNAKFCFVGYKIERQKTFFLVILGGNTQNSRFDEAKSLINQLKKLK